MYVRDKRDRIGEIIVVLSVFLVVLAVGIQQELRSESAPKAMVFLINEEVGGNGSVYRIEEDELIVVTTYHLLQKAEKVRIIFQDNSSADGTVIGVNEKHDVGFVEVEIEDIQQETLKNIACIQTKQSVYDSLEQGDYMEYCFLEYKNGAVLPRTNQGTIGHTNWYVSDFDDNLIYNYCNVKPGMSGCAAVAADGSYLGMMIGGYDNESGALSIRVIDKVYQELE